ncbi:MAG: hypothetical protein Q9228_007497 [Teloschistes exilis]
MRLKMGLDHLSNLPYVLISQFMKVGDTIGLSSTIATTSSSTQFDKFKKKKTDPIDKSSQNHTMPPAVRNFPHQVLSGPFSHLQQPHLQHHNSQHQTGSSNLPPPSFNAHHGLNQGNHNSNINPFAQNGNTNGLAAGFGGTGGLGGGGTGLASPAAVMGFHGAALQQQQAREQTRRGSMAGGSKNPLKGRIRDVWRGNLAQEMQVLRSLIDKYPYISMDTEFPGIVARPMGAFTTKADYHYQTLRCNVDLLKVIQLGITLFNEDGEPPHPQFTESSGLSIPAHHNNLLPCPCTWQFNFQFSAQDDMYNQDSIDFLATAGLDLDLHEKQGIDPSEFGAYLISSGLVLVDDVRWISFHSGYDFGYLVKLMLCKPLPEDETTYRKLLSTFFPAIYDIKFMIKHVQRVLSVNDAPLTHQASSILHSIGQKSGLQDLADELGVKRVGTAHQAGSDSLLTGRTFWEVKKLIFNGAIDDNLYIGQVWGLNGVGVTMAAHPPGFHNQNSNNANNNNNNNNNNNGNGNNNGNNNSNNYSSMDEAPNPNGATIYQPNGTQQQQGQAPPSTPGSSQPGLAHTPNQSNSMGSMTPGGGGGVFGGFRGFGRER